MFPFPPKWGEGFQSKNSHNLKMYPIYESDYLDVKGYHDIFCFNYSLFFLNK